MRSSSFIGALGGVVLLGTAAMSHSAMAYGPQWRPAQGYAPNPVARYQRIANIPSFRPSMGAAQRRVHAGRHDRYQHAGRHDRYQMDRPGQQRVAAWQRPAPRHQFAGRAQRGSSQYLPTPHIAPMGGWGGPFAPMAQMWQPSVPFFGQPLAWQPARQAWSPRGYAVPQPRYLPHDQGRAAFRAPAWGAAPQRHSAVAPGYRGWRPAQQRAVSTAPVSAAQVTQPVRIWTMDPLANTAALAQGYPSGAAWRPVGLPAPVVRADTGFRPAAYGRSQPSEQRLASGGTGAVERRTDLPGWATTYTDEVTGYACTWCSGS